MWAGAGYKPGCWCSGSWARTRSWGISSFRMESFSNPASSSMPKPTLCWARCLLDQFLQNIDFPSSVGGQERGSGMSPMDGPSGPLCSVIPMPWFLRLSWALWLLVGLLPWALGLPPAISSLLSHVSLVHLLSLLQKSVDISYPLLFPFQFSLTLCFIACQFSYCDKCILYESRNECGFSTPTFNPRQVALSSRLSGLKWGETCDIFYFLP